VAHHRLPADVAAKPLEPTDAAVGIDVGITELVVTSDGELVSDPRHLRRALDRLANTQRRAAGRTRGSRRRRQAA
jgi:putative transposase